jgi:hypothetical protein
VRGGTRQAGERCPCLAPPALPLRAPTRAHALLSKRIRVVIQQQKERSNWLHSSCGPPPNGGQRAAARLANLAPCLHMQPSFGRPRPRSYPRWAQGNMIASQHGCAGGLTASRGRLIGARSGRLQPRRRAQAGRSAQLKCMAFKDWFSKTSSGKATGEASTAQSRSSNRRDFLEARQLSLFEIFDGDTFKFDIPDYQRPYQWRSKQVRRCSASQPPMRPPAPPTVDPPLPRRAACRCLSCSTTCRQHSSTAASTSWAPS